MFDDQFFTAAGLDSLTAEEKQQLREQLAGLIQERLAVRLTEVLTEEQAEQFSNLMDKDGEAEAFKYLEEVFPQYGELVAQEVERARQELLQDMQQVAERLEAEPDDDATPPAA